MDKLLVEHVADALMEYIPSNMGALHNPADPTNYYWARTYALTFAEKAIEAMQSYKQSDDVFYVQGPISRSPYVYDAVKDDWFDTRNKESDNG